MIIGGGVIGLSIARELSLAGASGITLLEKGQTGKESSWAAGGMLAVDVETLQFDTFYGLCSESNRMYPAFAESLFTETGIDIELDLTGTILAAFSDEDETELEKRFGWQSATGVKVEKLTVAELKKLEPSLAENVRGGLYYSEDGQVENRKLLEALKLSVIRSGVNIVEETEVQRLVLNKFGRVTGAESNNDTFMADIIILANGAWLSNILIGAEKLHVAEIHPVKGQMICFEGFEDDLRNIIYSPRGYLIPRADGRILSGSTMEEVGFDRVVTTEAKRKLLVNAAEIFPALSHSKITAHWSGLRPMALDGLPILGPVAGYDGLIVAGGHFRNGILLAPVTARIIKDLVVEGTRSNYFNEFSVERFSATKKAVIK